MTSLRGVVLASVAVAAAAAAFASEDILAGFQPTGETRRCVHSYEIAETRVADDQTILFRLGVSRFYRNRLSRPCPSLKIQSRFKYKLSGTNDLCRGDIITVIDGVGTGPACILGEFEKLEKKAGDAS
jgi:hypothetical protein